MEIITGEEVLKHEPNLQTFEGGAHFFHNVTSIDDLGKSHENIFTKSD